VDSLYSIAQETLHKSISPKLSPKISRMDIRPDNGIVKILVANHFWAIQPDGSTGKVLRIERWGSDIIEMIHTGLIIDFYFKTGNKPIKAIYTTSMGLALLTLFITGFWLWWIPKLRKKESSSENHLA